MVRGTSDGDPSGVFIDGTNAIWNNAALGIDLVPSNQNIGQVIPNDPLAALDGDSGPNGLQNHPLISAAAWNSQGGVDLSYVLDSAATRSFTVAAFANPSCDASGNGEGRYPSGNGNVPVTSNATTASRRASIRITGSPAISRRTRRRSPPARSARAS